MKKYILCANPLWDVDMVQRLSSATGADFILLQDSQKLTCEYVDSLSPRYLFFPHWSYIIPKNIWSKYECIMFHMTDLPFGRGGSPLQNLIANGIYETQVTAFRCDEGIDSGAIYLKRPLSLYGSAEEIYIRASQSIEAMIADICNNNITAYAQQGEVISFARRKPEQSLIDSTKELHEIFDRIRMLDADGYPHAFLDIGNLRLTFRRASLQRQSILADVRITRIEDEPHAK